jgi:hypothetical protein
MTRRFTILIAALSALLPLCSANLRAEVRIQTGTDEQAKLPYWQLTASGIEVRLVQRLPDQTRAYFQARGFSAENAETIAQSCVFQTIFHNTSNHGKPDAVTYDLNEWVVKVDGHEQSMKVREQWRREWQRKSIPTPQQVAFNWSLFPTHQTYQPGDYNWGMSIFNLKPGTTFDLKLVWHQYGKSHSAHIKDIRCAPDVHPSAARGS